ncbi:hypothetical protein CPLU01_15018 [Colletotrichum plurivorum]|uniref:Uncharacterized protein n=1 Tax=Colletotrichum plurivorum TaxID=2175906 RepID=A0A8H6JFC2_9PEZI|nr:hypothetical protein CPLU01_15018 [Colletotrichum plurivorum]
MTCAKSPKSKFIPEIDETNTNSQGYMHRLQHGLGLWGLSIIGGGTAIILAVLGFLVFLWSGEGPEDSRHATKAWRWVVLNQHTTQAVTLSTVLLRVAVTAQSYIYTSLIAGIVPEGHGVPLHHAAEVSVIRCANDGPLRLSWLLLTSVRKSAAQAALAVVLLVATVAVQFSSTLLVSDLELSPLVGDSTTKSVRLHMSRDVISLNRQMNNWVPRPTAYVPFGEVFSAERNSTPSELGVADTGSVKRVFLPLSTAELASLRGYEGKAYAFESRFVCMRPSISVALSTIIPPPNTDTLLFYLFASGNISWESTFQRAGLPLPTNCDGGSCFPSSFNCSLPQFQHAEAQAAQGFESSLCLPDGRNARSIARNFTISEEPVAAYSQAFLFFRSNGTHDLWQGPGNTVLSGRFPLGAVSSTDGEWITYERSIGGRDPQGTRLDNGVMRLDVTACFQQLTFNMADVKISSDRDLREPRVSWDSQARRWNTSEVQEMLGTAATNTTTTRGIFSVDMLENPKHLDATQFLTNKLINDLYNSPRPNVSIFLDPLSSGISNVKPHVEYQAVFADALAATGRPGAAMQAILTVLAGSAINEGLPQFDVSGDVVVTASVGVPAPRRMRGLIGVLGVVAVHAACGQAAVLMLAAKCRYSSQGNYWQGLAQVVSDETAWVLEGASRSADSHVKREIGGGGPEGRL